MSDILTINTNTRDYMQELQQPGARRIAKDSLDKEDFLKILVTQLTHQDPTQPMEDREFIAQMAQFSSLEQMTNLNREFSRVAGIMAMGQATALIGKMVDIDVIEGKDTAGRDIHRTVSGRVQEITGGNSPQLLVNGTYYDYAAVARVKE
ncbi:MAG: flagellar hook assembly protein FlgD [Spirochaetales bacterium]|jgi:flagellar basal-body rod modification protein FlgD|nr:flagellar hook assembly protein FlgD [Spirochaetales bacterium]